MLVLALTLTALVLQSAVALTEPDAASANSNSPPGNGGVFPESGFSQAGMPMFISTTWQDPDGWEDLKHCWVHIGSSPSVVGQVTLFYNVHKNKLWILSDDASAWLGGYGPGTANTLENSQARVDCAYTFVTTEDSSLQVAWYITFKSSFTGFKKTGLKCKDMQKARAKGEWYGTWNVFE